MCTCVLLKGSKFHYNQLKNLIVRQIITNLPRDFSRASSFCFLLIDVLFSLSAIITLLLRLLRRRDFMLVLGVEDDVSSDATNKPISNKKILYAFTNYILNDQNQPI